MRKFFKQIHIWLSIPFGVVMSIICFTGAILVFERDITESVQREYYFVDETMSTTVAVSRVIASVEPMLGEGQRITDITISSDPERTWKVNLSQPKHAAIYVNQYTGEVIGTPERLSLFAVAFRLHRWLMDERPAERDAIYWGKLIVGISTIMMVVVILSGVVIWVPKSRAMWKNRSKIAVTKGWRRFMYDLHAAGGIYATLLLLAMALTGLTWSFPWYREGFYRLFSADSVTPTQQAMPSRANDVEQRCLSYDVWYDAYRSVTAHYEDYVDATISDGAISVKLGGLGNSRAADKYEFDTTNGEIISSEPYVDQSSRSKVGGWIYSVHVGSFGGMVVRIMWALAALLGATLPITGYYLWIKRKFCKSNK